MNKRVALRSPPLEPPMRSKSRTETPLLVAKLGGTWDALLPLDRFAIGTPEYPDRAATLVIDVDDYPSIEVGMVGREGMLGTELVLGLAKTPWRAMVQGKGHSWRLPATALRKALTTQPTLKRVLQASLLVRLHQQALASACERFHMIGPRVARWLLMSQDRAQADHFHVTQEFIALMLGVRRVGVTEAAGELQRAGLIEYQRGEMKVLNRAGLLAQACSCYAADRQLLAELSVHEH